MARSTATKQSSRFDRLKVPSLSRDWIAILLASRTLRAPRDDNSVKGKDAWYNLLEIPKKTARRKPRRAQKSLSDNQPAPPAVLDTGLN